MPISPPTGAPCASEGLEYGQTNRQERLEREPGSRALIWSFMVTPAAPPFLSARYRVPTRRSLLSIPSLRHKNLASHSLPAPI